MQVLHQLPQVKDPRVLVGTAQPDDAGVYLLQDGVALVQSVDVFTPVVDDPYDYGRVAAANAFSDLYAMGARPLFALNVVGFPINTLPLTVLARVLQGGAEKAREAGVVILGGHTWDDAEPKYGLAVTGVVHPQQLITNAGARVGDVLVLTKPLGIGTITTALKQGRAEEAHIRRVVELMATLNAGARDAMLAVGGHAATDITGYGFLGHLHEMLLASQVAAEVEASQVPILPEAWEYARQDVFPGGSRANRLFLTGKGLVEWPPGISRALEMLLCDAQTSGGLLIAVAPERVSRLLEELQRHKTPVAAVVGRVVDGPPGHIRVIL